MKVFRSLKVIVTITFLCCAFQAFADSTFIKFGSSWKYLDNGKDPGTSWNDIHGSATDSWLTGVAEFGYGNGDERTLIDYGGNVTAKPITTFFRKSFNISNASKFAFFKVRVYLDDAMVVYINGKQVGLYNMPAGLINYNTPASHHVPENGNITIVLNIPADKFVNGVNCIAVEVHQASAKSDDLTFDLELAGISKINPAFITRGPLLQMVSKDAITIRWKTNDNTSSKIQFGTSENSLVSVLKNDALSKDHELRLTGLQPDTKYYYTVGSGSDVLEGSYRNHFTTSPLANTTRKIRIGVFGDAGTGDLHQKGTRDSYLRLFKDGINPELALLLGDNAYNTGTDQEYQANFFDVYDDNILNNHVVFPVPGNHEYASPGVPYFSVFSLPAAGESGGLPSGTPSYYSFNYGNIHFIMLNSMGHDGGKPLGDSTSEQAVWLKKDLAANAGTHKWTIASLHHPPYTNGSHNSDGETGLIAIRQQITPILERYGVDAVLAGHSHVYERSFLIQGHTGMANTFKSNPPGTGNLVSGSSARYDGSENSCPYFTIDTVDKKGTVYVVAGSAGQIGGGTNADMPLFYYKNYSGTSGGEHGILYLEVEDNRLDAKFIGMSGTVRDQFTIMKGVNSKKTILAEVNKTVDLKASWIGSYNWIPIPPARKDGKRTLTVKPDRKDIYTYYVRDSIGPSKTCISDTFEIHAVASPAALPIDFVATQKIKRIILTWGGEIETETGYYTVEKSSNGQNFSLLTIIPFAVTNINSLSPALYEFEDNYPLPGTNYYRLTKTSGNARTVVIATRTVNFDAASSVSYQVRSNTTSNVIHLTVESTRKQLLQISIYDMKGTKVFFYALSAIEGSNKVQAALPSGIYVLNVTAPDNTYISEKILLR